MPQTPQTAQIPQKVQIPKLPKSFVLPNSPSSDLSTLPEGLLLVDKPIGCSSFYLVRKVRKRCNVKKVGHAGTLDPFASGLMILLVGKKYTRMSANFLNQDKEYIAELSFGKATDTYDHLGAVTLESTIIPTEAEVKEVISKFQGEISQVPPMYSAKKVNGKKLYDLARKGIEIERKPVQVFVDIQILTYNYPHLSVRVNCSKGTYIRSLAFDIGNALGCYAHLSALRRIRCGEFLLENSIKGEDIENPEKKLPLITIDD